MNALTLTGMALGALFISTAAAAPASAATYRVKNDDSSYNRATNRPANLLISDFSNEENDSNKELLRPGDRMSEKPIMRRFYIPYHCDGIYKRPRRDNIGFSDGWHSNPHPASTNITILITNCTS